MYRVKNNRRLKRQLIAHVCARPAVIVDLYDAAAFIDMQHAEYDLQHDGTLRFLDFPNLRILGESIYFRRLSRRLQSIGHRSQDRLAADDHDVGSIRVRSRSPDDMLKLLTC